MFHQVYYRLLQAVAAAVAIVLLYIVLLVLYELFPESGLKAEVFGGATSQGVLWLYIPCLLAIFLTVIIMLLLLFLYASHNAVVVLWLPIAEEISFHGVLLLAIFRAGLIPEVMLNVPHITFLTALVWCVIPFVVFHIPQVAIDALHGNLDPGRPLDAAIVGLAGAMIVVVAYLGYGLPLWGCLLAAMVLHIAYNAACVFLLKAPGLLVRCVIRVIVLIVVLVFCWLYFDQAASLWAGPNGPQ
ncbi:MAG: hypothetical protein KA184_07870 [Candidatus Hydrogenedentes bacterium]|nr:hypothetical protein [Candidatus Hydrogenedentota bacterium]